MGLLVVPFITRLSLRSQTFSARFLTSRDDVIINIKFNKNCFLEVVNLFKKQVSQKNAPKSLCILILR